MLPASKGWQLILLKCTLKCFLSGEMDFQCRNVHLNFGLHINLIFMADIRLCKTKRNNTVLWTLLYFWKIMNDQFTELKIIIFHINHRLLVPMIKNNRITEYIVVQLWTLRKQTINDDFVILKVNIFH